MTIRLASSAAFAFLLLATAAASAPMASASLNTRSVLTVGEYLGMGAGGLGIYDPDGDCLSSPCPGTTNPGDNYCVALFSEWDFFEVAATYYDGARIFVQASATAAVRQIRAALVPLAGIPVLQDCANSLYTFPLTLLLTPSEPCTANGAPSVIGDDCQWIYNDGLNVGVGTAIAVDGLLDPAAAASLSSAAVGLQYCTLKVGGRIGGEVAGDALGLDTAGTLVGDSDIDCNDANAGGINYAIPGGGNGGTCLTFLTSTLGDLVVDQPILLASPSLTTPICNSQIGGDPLGNFVTEVCISVSGFDFNTGLPFTEQDTDWFVNAGTAVAAYAQWILNPVGGTGYGGSSVTNLPDLNGGADDVTFGPQAQGTCTIV